MTGFELEISEATALSTEPKTLPSLSIFGTYFSWIHLLDWLICYVVRSCVGNSEPKAGSWQLDSLKSKRRQVAWQCEYVSLKLMVFDSTARLWFESVSACYCLVWRKQVQSLLLYFTLNWFFQLSLKNTRYLEGFQRYIKNYWLSIQSTSGIKLPMDHWAF